MASTQEARSGLWHSLPAWGTLDVGCAWQALGNGAAASHVQQQVAQFQPELVLGVDASSLEAYHSVFQAYKPAFVFMNYRWSWSADMCPWSASLVRGTLHATGFSAGQQ